jgi:glyoxylase-like metal-dependent hydrolase (beta-lactamase superfamily II)
MQLFSIEGNYQKLDGGSMFGNAPKALWERWIQADETNRIQLATRGLLMQTDSGENFLFEVGIGSFFEPKLKQRFGVEQEEHVLLKNLENIGLKHTDIDHVILSHLHFDHVGGLLPSYGQDASSLLFPKAKYYVSEKNWQRAIKPHPRDRASFLPTLCEKLLQSERLIFINEDKHPNIPGVRFTYSDGHTPGMMLSHFQTEQGPLVFTADLIPARFWIHLPITMGYDRFPELIIDEKAHLLQNLSDSKGFCFLTHDPLGPCVRITQDKKNHYSHEEFELTSLTIS